MSESAVVSRLLADTDVSSLISDRIYPLVLPTGVVYPALSYDRISTSPINSVEGESGLDNFRLSVQCWADDYEGALDLATKVRAAMNKNGQDLKSVFASQVSDFDTTVEKYRVITDFSIWSR